MLHSRVLTWVLAGFGGTIVTRVIGLLMVPALISRLGVRLYGLWAIVGVIVGAQGLFDLGLLGATTRYVSAANANNDRKGTIRIIRTVVIAYTALSGVMCVALVLVSPAVVRAVGFDYNTETAARSLALSAGPLFVISNYAMIAGAVIQGQHKFVVFNAALIASQLILVVSFVLLSSSAGELSIVWATFLMYTVQLLMLVPIALRNLPDPGTLPPTVSAKRIMSFGLKLQFVSIADFLVLQAPRLVAGVILSASAATQIDLGLRLALLGAAAGLPLLPPISPLASQLSAVGETSQICDLYVRFLRCMGLLAMPVFCAIIAFGPVFMDVWVGDAAAGLGWVVRLLALCLLVHTIGGVATQIALGAERADIVLRMKMTIGAFVLSTLIPATMAWGITGLASSLLVSFVAGFIVLEMGVRSVVGPLSRAAILSLARPASAAVLGAGIAFVVAIPWLSREPSFFGVGLAVGIFVVLYVALTGLTGGISVAEVQALLRRPVEPRSPVSAGDL